MPISITSEPNKVIIYQIFTRLYTNKNATCKENGSIEENGSGKFNDITADCLRFLREKGITHVWYTGVLRHASTTDYTAYGIPISHPAVVKGRAGSPYAIADYYDVDPDLAVDINNRKEEFRQLIERSHKEDLKVIIDFVPNHVARQYHSIAAPAGVKNLGEDDDSSQGFNPAQNNFYYCPGTRFNPSFDLQAGAPSPYEEFPAKATGNDHFDASPGKNDWYETVKLNYGVDYYAGKKRCFNPIPNTWQKMLDILIYWASFGVDGFRCDMAEMVPVEFWEWALPQLKKRFPEVIIIGEVYNPSLYRRFIEVGFDYLYDKVGMYDILRAVTCGKACASEITLQWQLVSDISSHMLYFLENHDEQRIASPFFADDPMKAIPALAVCLLLRTNPFMLYFGQQYGEKGIDKEGFSGRDGRTTIFDYWSLASMRRAFAGRLSDAEKMVAEKYYQLMKIAQTERSVIYGQMFDLMYPNIGSGGFDARYHYAFMRKWDSELLLVVVNFSSEAADVNVEIPSHAFDVFGITETVVVFHDILHHRRHRTNLKRATTILVYLEPYGVSVVKMRIPVSHRQRKVS